eukprot:TRINITY_DN36245_c0_g1_i1.p1 TRINITY_DN36245_c0_g1~~TRINITY_DN36245_c0_g1_i1.p1  ORF type:complete len:538 (+),score=115.92 TRINITY_DN36245_c0_g1_i1:71-1684(+)
MALPLAANFVLGADGKDRAIRPPPVLTPRRSSDDAMRLSAGPHSARRTAADPSSRRASLKAIDTSSGFTPAPAVGRMILNGGSLSPPRSKERGTSHSPSRDDSQTNAGPRCSPRRISTVSGGDWQVGSALLLEPSHRSAAARDQLAYVQLPPRAAGEELERDTLAGAPLSAMPSSRASSSSGCPPEGLEPAELVAGLRPRSDGPRAKVPTGTDLAQVETFVIDCDGLLWNIVEDLTSDLSPERYRQENVAFMNTMSQCGMSLIFTDSKGLFSRHELFAKLQSLGLQCCNSEESWACQAVDKTFNFLTPGCAAAWYLRKKGTKKPFILTSQASLVADVRASGFSDCVATMDEDGYVLEAFKGGKQVSSSDLKAALEALEGVDAVVLGSCKEISPLEAAVVMKLLARTDVLPHLVSCCGINVRRRLKSLRNSVACRSLFPGTVPDCQDFVDMLLPSRLVSAALTDAPEDGGFGVNPSTTVVVGRTLERHVRFAHRAGMASMLIMDSLAPQLEFMKLSQQDASDESLPDWVLPSLGHMAK